MSRVDPHALGSCAAVVVAPIQQSRPTVRAVNQRAVHGGPVCSADPCRRGWEVSDVSGRFRFACVDPYDTIYVFYTPAMRRIHRGIHQAHPDTRTRWDAFVLVCVRACVWLCVCA